MNHRQFELQLGDGRGAAVDGTFSWNGTAQELALVLQSGKARASLGRHSNDSWDVLAARTPSGAPGPVEQDPVGASSFIIAVILLYGLSIIFLIASHVFIKRRAYRDTEKQINGYLERAGRIQAEGERQQLRRLKWSLVPRIAESASGRTLIAGRLQYRAFLKENVSMGSGIKPPGLDTVTERDNEETFDRTPNERGYLLDKPADSQRIPQTEPATQTESNDLDHKLDSSLTNVRTETAPETGKTGTSKYSQVDIFGMESDTCGDTGLGKVSEWHSTNSSNHTIVDDGNNDFSAISVDSCDRRRTPSLELSRDHDESQTGPMEIVNNIIETAL